RSLAHWSACRTAPNQSKHLDIRRPCVGFNPQIYAHHHPGLRDGDRNPFADFIRTGRPEGPWCHSVIRPDASDTRIGPVAGLHVGIQAHFHYPELIDDFLAKLAANETACDLLLTTNDEAKVKFLRHALGAFDRGRSEVRLVPNRGRDI